MASTLVEITLDKIVIKTATLHFIIELEGIPEKQPNLFMISVTKDRHERINMDSYPFKGYSTIPELNESVLAAINVSVMSYYAGSYNNNVKLRVNQEDNNVTING